MVRPAVERQSLSRALGMDACSGLPACTAFDLTSLALLRDFPVVAALTDLAWGMCLSAAVSGAAYAVARVTG